jgi:hypothetical protein
MLARRSGKSASTGSSSNRSRFSSPSRILFSAAWSSTLRTESWVLCQKGPSACGARGGPFDQGRVGLVAGPHGIRMGPVGRHAPVGLQPEIPHAPKVAHEDGGSNLRREVDRPLRLAQPLVPLPVVGDEGWKKLGAAWRTPIGSGQKLCVDPTLQRSPPRRP